MNKLILAGVALVVGVVLCGPSVPAQAPKQDGADAQVGAPKPAAKRVADLEISVGTKFNDVHVVVKNVGKARSKTEQRLMVVKVAPNAVPSKKATVGPLAPGASVRLPSFSLPGGKYKAYLKPGDAPRYAANDSATFVVRDSGPVPVADIAIEKLDVSTSGGAGAAAFAHVTVKNVGTEPVAAGRTLMLARLGGAALPYKRTIGALAPGQSIELAKLGPLGDGSYKAYVDPGDPAPHAANDSKTFEVRGLNRDPFADIAIEKVDVMMNFAHVTVKNVGTAPVAAGRNLVAAKLSGAVVPYKRTIGALAPGQSMELPKLGPLANGNYKAYVDPGDTAPYAANDSKTFTILGPGGGANGRRP